MAGGRGTWRRVSAGWSACALCLPALLLAGCSGSTRLPNDPLNGGGPALAATDKAPPVPVAAAAGTPGPLPALAAPASTTSAAALAPGAMPQRGGQGAGGAVSLSRPQPIAGDSNPARLQPMTPVTLTGGSGGVSSIDRGLETLKARGVKGFRLDLQPDTGQWRCICSIPKVGTIKQTYSTSAGDALSAVRAVIEKVEQENR